MANLSNKEGAYTPAPWKAEAYNLRMGSLISYGDISKGQSVAIALAQKDALTGKANARLIAAAPELLEALKAIFEDNCFYHKDGDERAYLMAIRAIKKAEGTP